MAGNHFEKGKGDSSKIVPTLAENCLLQPLQFHTMRDSTKRTLELLQRGHRMTPSGHLRLTTHSHAARSFEK